MNKNLLTAAQNYSRAGLSIIPIDHKSKRPSASLLPNRSWKSAQVKAATAADVERWISGGARSVAVVCGQVSGGKPGHGLLVIDFDVAEFYPRWIERAGEAAANLPVQKTGGGGYQVLLRCPQVGSNDKLAWVSNEDEPSGRSIAIETRGEGGYAVLAPSEHPSGNLYQWVSGNAGNVPIVTQQTADHLLAVARSLDEVPLTRQERERLENRAFEDLKKSRKSRIQGDSVIADFNSATSVAALLGKQGYTQGPGGRYIRPGGKSESVSIKDGRSCHWSTNDVLNDGRGPGGCGCHDAFSIFTLFEHGGDVASAVKSAAKLLGKSSIDVTQTGRARNLAKPDPYVPFPLDCLPTQVRQFVDEGSHALGCDAAYIAMPLLAILASAIGNSRRIQLKNSWTEPPILWTIVVGDSGTLKSPAFDLAMRAIRLRQNKAWKEYRQAKSVHRLDMEEFEMANTDWKKTNKEERGPRPEEPPPPVEMRFWCSDPTVEALADRLSGAPRGLLLARDELSGWFGSFNQYKAGQGGDVAHYLEMHRGGNLLVDRKTGDKTTIHVPSAALCIAGGIQPDTLRRCMSVEFFENGLAARFLLTMPPRRAKKWSESDIAPATLDEQARLLNSLLEFQPSQDSFGEPTPALITLTGSAKAAWIDFYNKHASEQAGLEGELAAAWSKLEGYAARFALVIHCARQACGEDVDPWTCDDASMKSGIALASWFGGEAKRVYSVLAERSEDREQRRLIELLEARGGSSTIRELCRSSRLYPDSRAWAAALQQLESSGVGRWEFPTPSPAGGHPTKVFVLNSPSSGPGSADALTVDTTHEFAELGESSGNCQHGVKIKK